MHWLSENLACSRELRHERNRGLATVETNVSHPPSLHLSFSSQLARPQTWNSENHFQNFQKVFSRPTSLLYKCIHAFKDRIPSCTELSLDTPPSALRSEASQSHSLYGIPDVHLDSRCPWEYTIHFRRLWRVSQATE